jgi:dTMP kinase
VTHTGLFVVVEGPNGVGKSTAIELATEIVRERLSRSVHATREPSSTSLGASIRELEPTLPPEALALACAADRHDHVRREIEPALDAGAIVVTDRYVPSSLVLQRLDGLDLEYVWALNSGVRVPDLTVYLDDETDAITSRLAERDTKSRFEHGGTAEKERELYAQARDFLGKQGWPQLVVDCRGLSAEAVSEALAGAIVAIASSD